MASEIQNLMKVCFSLLSSLSFCYFVVRKIPKGFFRLLILLPFLYLFTFQPLNFTSPTLRSTSAFLITWLANFNLLLFSFDKGPLSSHPPPKSLLRFICEAFLPIKVKQGCPSEPNSTPTIIAFATNCFLSALVLYIYLYHKSQLHPQIMMAIYGCYIYLSLELLFAAGATTARLLLGIDLEPQSNKPYLATSLQDFWGRRWNLVVSSILRPTIYNPVKQISMCVLDQKWAAVPAILATFIVSGLMHELVFYYFTSCNPTWEVTWFFILHGICTAVEVAAKKALSWRLHPAISCPLTVGFVAVTTVWLFLPPIVRSGTDVRSFNELLALLEFLREKIRHIPMLLSMNTYKQ
ncbi:probable long-chain-alcohol O-fatty-acyltransferase 5 [Telopea speciosissima]|uniref:probable long-chain-alcohol O-fatty-acyltransferase 5 n=1 Tax=Telopea speciosissima TaxID=54955 RepID=UPI001CC74AE0|nr:probable long-chain-alcohol O-fatty-acyltransferase 5 [Telopea speciosissima]